MLFTWILGVTLMKCPNHCEAGLRTLWTEVSDSKFRYILLDMARWVKEFLSDQWLQNPSLCARPTGANVKQRRNLLVAA